MSELKAFTFSLGRYTEDGYPCVVAVDDEDNPRLASDEKFYLKSEADKVIAELEMKLAVAQQTLRLNKPEALFSDLEIMGRLKHQIDVVERRERHQKYKRCLAMAQWCMDAECKTEKDADFLVRWEHRWLALAEKFKEAK